MAKVQITLDLGEASPRKLHLDEYRELASVAATLNAEWAVADVKLELHDIEVDPLPPEWKLGDWETAAYPEA